MYIIMCTLCFKFCGGVNFVDFKLLILEEIIPQHFIPAITRHPPCSPCERQLLALPPRLGGLGLSKPSSDSQIEFESSKQVTASLAALIILQDPNGFVTEEPKHTKAPVQKAKREKQLADAHNVMKAAALFTPTEADGLQLRRVSQRGSQPFSSFS